MAKKLELIKEINSLNEQASAICYEDPKTAIQLAQKAQKLAQSEVFSPEIYQTGLACSIANLAKAYSVLGEYSKTLELGTKALALAQEINDLDALSCSLEALGTAYRDLEDWPSAIETQLQRLDIARQLEARVEEAHALNRLGSIYSHMGRFEDALEQYQIALPIFEANDDKLAQASIYHNSCIEYTQLGQYDEALQYGLLSLKIYEEVEPEQIRSRSRTHIIVADVYRELGQYNEAIQHCEIALNAIRDDEVSYNLMGCQFRYGQIHTKLGNFDEAIVHFEKSLSIAEELKTPHFIYESYHELSKIYKLKEEFEKALSYYEQFHELKEAVFNENNSKKVHNLEILHRTRETQRELEQQKKLREDDWQYFESLDKMKDEVLHSVSHDLKSPLSSILTATYFLSRYGKTSDEKGREVLARIEASAKQMQLLISNILDLARLETGRSLATSAIQFVPLLENIVREHELQANQRSIIFRSNIQPDSSAIIEADKQLLKRAISNLLSNAIKYTEVMGTIEVIVHSENEAVVVAIRDDGIGIAKEDLPHIFERFYRAKNSSADIEGTGLGLSIVQTIFEQHGGHISVTSMEGTGTTFRFALPLIVTASV